MKELVHTDGLTITETEEICFVPLIRAALT